MKKKKLTKKISIVWSGDDVRQQAEFHDVKLTDQEVSDILDMMLSGHDANYGITWETISVYIDMIKRN